MEKDLLSNIERIADKHNIQFYATWGIEGGRGWIWIRQDAENDYTVQIFVMGNYDLYSDIKNEIANVLTSCKCILEKEIEVKEVSFGYRKNLFFIDADKYYGNLKKRQEVFENLRPQSIGTQINGSVSTSGGNLNTGDASVIDNSTTNNTATDKKWFQKEIVKCVLSFIGGVGATVVAQWIMRLFGWIH